MRFSTSAIVAFASSFAFVAAQDLSNVPSCAVRLYVHSRLEKVKLQTLTKDQ
jgi:hypothetical protein